MSTENAETWQPHGEFMIRIGEDHFAAIDRTGDRWREYPRDYTTTLRDQIIADRAKAAALGKLVEHLKLAIEAGVDGPLIDDIAYEEWLKEAAELIAAQS